MKSEAEIKRVLDDMAARAADIIDKTGRCCTTVFGPDANSAFTYTTGNYLVGLPEVIVFGLVGAHASAMLIELSEKMIERGRAFDDGEDVDLGGRFPLHVLAATDAGVREHLVLTRRFAGSRTFSVMQAVVCDLEGRLPWDEGCASPYRDVKIWRRCDG